MSRAIVDLAKNLKNVVGLYNKNNPKKIVKNKRAVTK